MRKSGVSRQTVTTSGQAFPASLSIAYSHAALLGSHLVVGFVQMATDSAVDIDLYAGVDDLEHEISGQVRAVCFAYFLCPLGNLMTAVLQVAAIVR